jgi:hypothetical protein
MNTHGVPDIPNIYRAKMNNSHLTSKPYTTCVPNVDIGNEGIRE